MKEAEQAGIGQKEVTPYLLARINELTGGKSLAANIALIKNNAALAARSRSRWPSFRSTPDEPSPMPAVLVIGDVMTDIVVKPDGPIAVGADRRAMIRAASRRGRREPGVLARA